MLLEFTVENFMSFKEKQTLSMYADSLKELKDYVHISYDNTYSFKVLKSMAIYGHNSHGKSNFFKAYKTFINLIINPVIGNNNENKLPLESYKLNTETKNKASFFEIKFLIKDVKYRYLLLADSETIFQEELYYSEPKIRENHLFTRRANEFNINKNWNKDNNGEIENIVRFAKKNHILFISVLFAQEYITHTSDIYKWISNNEIITNLNEQNIFNKAKTFAKNPEYHNLINKFIENADLGFVSYMEKTQNQIANDNGKYEAQIYKWLNFNNIQNFDLATIHTEFDNEHNKIGDVYFDLHKNESSGSIKYFLLACFLTHAIRNNQLILIDEIDSKLHPNLLELIIKIYNSSKLNLYGSQMIFSSHNTSLLNKKLRRDQLTLIHKNEFGESSIVKAHTSETPIRTDKSIEKEYLSGNLKDKKGNTKGVSKKLKDTLQSSLFDF